MNYLEIRKISTHNLKNIDLKIPLNCLVLITGPSGVGKSSLAINTIAEEGKHRLLQILNYTKSLNPVVFSKALFVSPVPPVIPLTQGIKYWFPYKTVAEFLGIFKFIEILFSFYAKFICPHCGFLNKISSIGDIFNWFKNLKKGEKFYFLIPIYQKSPKVLEYLLSQGYVKYLIDGQEIDLSEKEPPQHFKEAFIILDKMIKEDKNWDRFLENIRVSLAISNGRFSVKFLNNYQQNFNVRPICFRCSQPLDINWNYCKKCRGLGYKEKIPCDTCKGFKLNIPLLKSKIEETTLEELLKFTLADLLRFLKNFKEKFKDLEALIEIVCKKLELAEFLEIDYLSLLTPAFKLSIGEKKLLEILQIFGLDLNYCLYVLDEPTLGLDLEKRKKVLDLIKHLVKNGNSVICIEHDPFFIKEADFIIELGYKGGEKGGYLLKSEFKENYFSSKKLTLTLEYFLKKEKILKTFKPSKPFRFKKLEFEEIKLNLKIGAINLIYGKVGSGKTEIFNKLKNFLINSEEKILVTEKEEIKKGDEFLINYLNIWDKLKEFFVKLPYSRIKGLSMKHFSFHTKEGVCEECKGKGKKTYQDEDTLIENICEGCLGKKLNKEALNLEYKGLKLYEILDLSVEEAFYLFSNLPEIQEKLSQIINLGLGYLKLSQEYQTLSGGEKTRISLIKNIFKKRDFKYVFLEFPLEGLHLEDIKNLYKWFQTLLVKDITIVILETNPLAIVLSDHIIEIENKKIVFQGEFMDWLESKPQHVKEFINFYCEFVETQR